MKRLTLLKAKELAENNVQNGTIIITDNQTKGIGTHDRKWISSKSKNLTFTIILYPHCGIDNLNTLTIDIAKKLVQTIYELYNYKLNIKEPNDIMINGKKIGGILTQITTTGNKIKYLLIGIGFNVNQTYFENDLVDIATSLKLEFHRDFDKKEILNKFLFNFENYLKKNNIL